MMKIASGGKGGEAEASQMISEKIDAGFELQKMALASDLSANGAAKTLGYYRRKVSANRRRLLKGL